MTECTVIERIYFRSSKNSEVWKASSTRRVVFIFLQVTFVLTLAGVGFIRALGTGVGTGPGREAM